MSDQSTPEIDRLEAEAFPPVLPAAKDKAVWLPDAIQAVRDTRGRAFREAVEAFDRTFASYASVNAGPFPTHLVAVLRDSITALSPDNPEGNA